VMIQFSFSTTTDMIYIHIALFYLFWTQNTLHRLNLFSLHVFTGSGLKMKSPCTITSDTVCEPLEGFYCVDPSDNVCGAAQKQRSCEPGQCICQKGWFSYNTRTASTDSVCSDCSDGSFSDGTFPSCRPHTQ
uniref:TNFR-Cys domain-containing protein n=1 Tax=Anabas testudineus TaxID=64144 RepID=A0A3Q1JIF9_ANATE